MNRSRWLLAALGAVSTLAGGAAGAVLYTNLALAAAPAAAAVTSAVPFAAASPQPSPNTHSGCPHHTAPTAGG